MTELTLPLLGDVMTEGTLAKWLQADGAAVQAGEPLYSLETDKVTMTVEAPDSGTLERIVAEGETVPVGTVVGRLVSGAASGTAAVTPNVRATPAARALARDLGVDLQQLANGQRIREADVRAFAERMLAKPTSGVPLAGRRKVIAERMHASLGSTAQLTVSMEVDMTAALQLREQLRQLTAEVRQPGITDLVMRASVLALREHPALNATLRDGQLKQHAEIHVGLAVDAEEGLIVPVIRDAHTLSLLALAQRTQALGEAARRNTLVPEDVQGGTFTVTTLGALGVDFFTPILNPPQVAILGVGRVFDRVELVGGQVQERKKMYLNLSFDHQVVDGAPAARFLQSVKRNLELPAALVVDLGQ